MNVQEDYAQKLFTRNFKKIGKRGNLGDQDKKRAAAVKTRRILSLIDKRLLHMRRGY